MLKVVKMKRGQVNGLLNGLAKFKDNKNGSANWKYSVFKNIKTCEAEVEAFPKETITKIENQRMQLCVEMCEKDELGHPIVVDNKYKITNLEEFNKQYSLIYEAMKSEINDYNEFMKSEIELGLHMVTVNDLPDAITPGDMELISFMID